MAEIKRLMVPAIFKVGAPTKDHGMRFSGETQELSDADKLTMLGFNGEFGYLTFSTEQLTALDLPKEMPTERGQKTPAQRLRAVIYVLYQQSNRPDLTPDEFYSRQMEKIIEAIKEKLDQ